MTMELRREAAAREEERLAVRRREEEFARDARSVAASPEGRRFLRRIFADADLFNPSWTPGEDGAYRAGRRARALELWRVVRPALPFAEAVELLMEKKGESND